MSQFDNFSFINENQSTISGDRSAIQLEYEFLLNNTKIHTFTIFTEDNNSFYQFSFHGDPETYSDYLADFEKIINTVELTS